MTINTGDTAWILISTALVFLMTPGLAYFYGGLVRRKNVVNTLLSIYVLAGIVTIEWILFGYSMVFGNDIGGVIGGTNFLGLSNVGIEPNAEYAATIPHILFMAFQLMFAIITPGLIVGSIVERMKFSSFIIFIIAWTILVYNPIAHWVWGVGGWIRELGALDFAGGNVVHISSGIAGLIACIILGKRKGYKKNPMLPHNVPYIMIGLGLLWFGWLGFNGGSALGANGVGTIAFVNTMVSAAVAMISWIIVEYIFRKKVSLIGSATGALAGLVAITPGAGYVTVLAALLIGLLVSPICFISIFYIKKKFGYDDSLDAFGCHGIGGIFGGLATGLFATVKVNELGANGLFYGNPELLLNQVISIIATILFSATVTAIILLVIKKTIGIRVHEEAEINGLDIEVHGEEAFGEM
ncbi:MAG: ammonium transporter [Clostridium sp.]